jgi:beta-glucanase (GH16 family)
MKRALSLIALALGAWWGCTVDRSGLQQAVSPGGGGDSANPIGGAAAVGGASGKSGAAGADAAAGSGGELNRGGTAGSDAYVGSGGAPSNGGTSGSEGGAPSGGTSGSEGGAPSGGTSGSERGAPGGGTSGSEGSAPSGGTSGSEGGAPSGGTSGSEGGAPSGGTSSGDGETGFGGAPSGGTSGNEGGAPSGGTSGSDGGEGSDSASGGSTSGRDTGLGSNDGATRDGLSASDAGFDSGTSPNWHLVWSDDFTLDVSTGVDATKWTPATSDPGTVNGEKQKYTARAQNIFHDDQGHLVLRGLHDSWRSNGTTYPYTSARVETDGIPQLKFGRVEVRAKLPAGQGSYPAILLMGTTGNWPQCGEIGIMEQWGQDKSWLYCSSYSGASSDINQKVTFPNATTLSSDFHVYALEWYSDHMVFFIDGAQVARSDFDKTSPFYTGTFYIILEVAIGGTMGGTIDDAGGFPIDMALDYLRVYSQQ